MLKPILIITPFFAPQTHAAMFRVHKLVKYLPEYGYKPIVLTTDINYLYNNNKNLLDELPDCVEIVRTRHIEPSLRGLRMAFGGKDRTFSTLKKNQASILTNNVSFKQKKPNFLKKITSKIYSLISIFLYSTPDPYWTWALASRKTAENLIKKHNIKIMYTTANPYSHLILAEKLKDKLGLKWLADFRDPCGYGYKNSTKNYLGYKLQQLFLKKTFDKADKITGLAETYSSIFSDLYNLSDSDYTYIPTGVDDVYLPKIEEKNNNYKNSIIFSGEVMPEQEIYIFQVCQEAHKINSEINIIFIGRSEINKPIIESLLINIIDWKINIKFIDHLPQNELYIILQSAKACILAPGPSRYWWTNFAKMVDYIALGIPVIADVPNLSEARKELTRAGLGFFLKRDSAEKDALRLHKWLETFNRTHPGTEYRKRYLASTQVEIFAQEFDKLTGKA